MLQYKVHVQNQGWTGWLQEGRFAGTTGEGLRIEAIIIDGVDEYRVHVQNKGWTAWVEPGGIAGTTGKGLRIEAIEIKKEGLNYQVHVKNVGWMDWARNGETAGTTGGGLRIEAIRLLTSVEPLKVDDSRASFAIAPPPIVNPVLVAVASKPKVQAKKSGKIYFAVGHGIMTNGVWDPGCVDKNYTEAGLMFAIGKPVVAKLRNMGFTVNSDADTGNNKNIAVGVAEANNWGADLYVSIHCDYNLAPSGTLPIVYPGSVDGVRLANCLIASIKSRMGLGTRGIIQRDDWEVADTNATACIFETGSIRADINKLLDAEKFAEAIAQGIYDYM